MLNKRFGRVLFCCGYFCFVLDIFLLVHGLGQGFNVLQSCLVTAGRGLRQKPRLQGEAEGSLKGFWAPRLVDGEGNGTPLQYSCLENPMDGGAW